MENVLLPTGLHDLKWIITSNTEFYVRYCFLTTKNVNNFVNNCLFMFFILTSLILNFVFKNHNI